MKKTYCFLLIILIVFHWSPCLSQVNLNGGLIAYYPFSGNANDASGNGLNGIVQNDVKLTTDKFGNPNSAYYFDGSNQYIIVNDNGKLSPQSISVAAYVYSESISPQSIVGKIDYTTGNAGTYDLGINYDVQTGFYFGTTPVYATCFQQYPYDPNNPFVKSNNNFSVNTWHCVVGTFENSSLKIYVDGLLVDSRTTSYTDLLQCSNTQLLIGSWWSGDLIPFKGKIDEVRIYNRAINQQEVSALCDLCNQPQGSLIGNTICSGTTGTLTFNSSIGMPPFTIQYTDGINKYTQTNVTSGVPFPVAINPTTTTTYILDSIADATSCSRTLGFIQDTAKIIVNNCSLCKGSLGDPVVNITFGSGASIFGPPLQTTSTGYGYQNSGCVIDNNYEITNQISNCYVGDWHTITQDHTGNPGGYFMLIGASDQPSDFYLDTVRNVCASTTYEFAAWVLNMMLPTGCVGTGGLRPNVTFSIEDVNGNKLGVYNTGNIDPTTIPTWVQYGLFFTTPANATSIVLRMTNNGPGGCGNDILLDDITFRTCGPLITASFNSASIVDSLSVCQKATISLYGNATNGYANPGYLWQYSADSGSTWIDIPNSNSLQISLTAPLTGVAKNYKYRMLSGEGTNINSANCRVSSNLTILNVRPGPLGKLSSQGVCPGQHASLIFTSASTPSPFSITWTDGTNSYNQNNLNNNSSFLTSFVVNNTSTYTLHSVTDATGCTNTLDSVFSIPVNPLPHAYLTEGTICTGDSAVVLFTATSGASPFNIAYAGNGNAYALIGLNNNSTFIIPYLLTDTTAFTLTSVTDANGCTANPDTAATVNVDPLPQGGITGSTACAGDSAGITFNASSGIGPFELEISDGTNTTTYYDIQSGVPFRITPVTGTTNISLISIIDQDGSGCTRTNGFTSPVATIAVIPSPVVQFDSLTPICIQQSAFLITQASEISGIAGNGSFSGSGVDANGNFSPSNAGVGIHTIIYSYTANDGCSSSDSSRIVVNPTPSVSAGADIITCIGFPVQLKATGGSTYVWSPATGLDNPDNANPIATIDSTTTYTVLGTDSNGCYATDTITVNVGKNGVAAFVVPNAFTPNGDGHNDCFGISRWGGVTIVEFTIFNRWGQLVFTSKNPSDCWDGTYQGKLQETGGYPYIIKVKSPCGDITRTGIVMLVR